MKRKFIEGRILCTRYLGGVSDAWEQLVLCSLVLLFVARGSLLEVTWLSKSARQKRGQRHCIVWATLLLSPKSGL